eukprot:TRINITY_DN2246_c0_g1_i3.p1 TRINITY_DN2246_c0_g1~~TRINITY_DN2246_c0_g1_i3.p1  ORF type:complete len:266 (+),score=62.27 TRINITY_DN2246_c0_g1_i3:1678-2475(+)
MEQQAGRENDPPGMEVYGGEGAENGVYNPADGGGGGDGAEADGSGGDGSGVEFVVLNDDVLTSVANATLVLLDGSDMERLAVLYQFPQFLEHCPSDTLGIMVPEICRDALRWKEDVQMAAAEALYFVVNMRVPDAVAKRVVVAALRILQLSESGDVFDAWGEILSMMLPQVRRDDVVTLVVPATAGSGGEWGGGVAAPCSPHHWGAARRADGGRAGAAVPLHRHHAVARRRRERARYDCPVAGVGCVQRSPSLCPKHNCGHGSTR